MEHLNSLDPNLVLDSIYNGVVAIDSQGIITYFNKTAEKIFGIPANGVLNRYVLDILPNTGGKLLECLETGKAFYGEKLKAERVALIANISPIGNKGKIWGAVSVFQDTCEIESISKELDLFKNTKDWLDAIIDSSYDGLFICDHDGKVIRINKATERIDGVQAAAVIGKNVRDLVRTGLIDKSVTLEVLKKKASVTMIQQIRDSKKVLVTGNPIYGEDGKITFVVINVRDISELDQLRSQLQETQALAKSYISKISELEMKGVDLSTLIFRSTEMERIVEMALRVSGVDSTVLLLGNSGVGKGLLAKLIHKHSERNQGPFIRVDCAGVPESLFESELFGYEKGAFTGAKIEGKPGFFELANMGTLFLDEICEIPLGSQSKLLHFLEDHEIIRVGGTELKKINVRVIAATNRDIKKMVSSRQFREDLYYRLNVVPIYIQPLKERREDILPLVFHYIENFNKAYQKKKVLSPEVVDALSNYDFPGNIRELANLTERLVVVSEKDRIEMADLPGIISDGEAKDVLDVSFVPEGIPLKEAVRSYENSIIERTIKKHGSQREAAKALRMNQGSISRKLKRGPVSRNDVLLHK